MRMLLLFGDHADPDAYYQQVWFDSSDPAASADKLGKWWMSQIYLHPQLLQVEAMTSDGLNVYQVLSVEGPLFDLGRVYVASDSQKGEVTVVSRQQKEDTWIYGFRVGNDERVYSLTEDALFSYLTENVSLAYLLKVQ